MLKNKLHTLKEVFLLVIFLNIKKEPLYPSPEARDGNWVGKRGLELAPGTSPSPGRDWKQRSFPVRLGHVSSISWRK